MMSWAYGWWMVTAFMTTFLHGEDEEPDKATCHDGEGTLCEFDQFFACASFHASLPHLLGGSTLGQSGLVFGFLLNGATAGAAGGPQ